MLCSPPGLTIYHNLKGLPNILLAEQSGAQATPNNLHVHHQGLTAHSAHSTTFSPTRCCAAAAHLHELASCAGAVEVRLCFASKTHSFHHDANHISSVSRTWCAYAYATKQGRARGDLARHIVSIEVTHADVLRGSLCGPKVLQHRHPRLLDLIHVPLPGMESEPTCSSYSSKRNFARADVQSISAGSKPGLHKKY